MTEPNWLLSTAAQSAAALVAIVAGFLVSRVISLSAERNAAKSRLNHVEGELQLKQRAMEAAESQLLVWDTEDFVEDSWERIVKGRRGRT